MISDLFSLFEKLDKSGGWFFQFLSYFFAGVLITVFVVYVIRLWKGEINWLGQPTQELIEGEGTSELVASHELLRKELEAATEQLALAQEEAQMLKSLYDELDQKYDDETYSTSQIMYAASEVSLALYDQPNFLKNRDDVYDNLLDYLINTLKDFREKSPRIVIHVKHPNQEGLLVHFTHSSGFTHRVKEYMPPIFGSAAGRAWRTQDLYYIPDVESSEYEYERKARSSRAYRTLVSVPISAGTEPDSCIGVLSLTGTPVNAYEKIELERVVLFTKLLFPLILTEVRNPEVNNHSEMGTEKGS
ncbi:GAF domain-containing protein [Risungbinella massiliensis]|uniref:GAF domain-containing protein n=1 Tax=Risungbinella massiliensis TaxID=1329796 RepID=UPI0005CBB435|nr:GAF domain-containing protein [Risungbinella massiliensis]